MNATAKKWGVRLAALAATVGAGWWLVGALGLVALVGDCRGHEAEQEAVIAPVVAPPTAAEAKADDKVLADRDVRAIEPGKKERARIAEEYHREDLREVAEAFEASLLGGVADGGGRGVDELPRVTAPAPRVAEIVGERILPVMRHGGKALVTLEPDGRVELTTVANPEPRFEWRSAYEFGGLYGVGSTGDARWRAWAAAEPLRVGHLHLRVEAGAEQRAGQVDAYAMAGAVWRGGRDR